ncbi:Major basic nuclear protein or histone like protein [Amphidinium carterae]|mmetsp:Transcript_43243/g.97350  ORF Transcript_43243/g.97350 Transcript_43243/m.97350 type:complete len:112 (-) Transcript_43243:153-488(-)
MLPKTKKTSAAKAKVMTQTEVYKIVAEKTGFARKQVKGAVDALMELSAEQVKKAGSFKVAGMLNMKLKSKPATKARKGLNPFTKEPCVFKAKPASKTVKVLALKKLKDVLN